VNDVGLVIELLEKLGVEHTYNKVEAHCFVKIHIVYLLF